MKLLNVASWRPAEIADGDGLDVIAGRLVEAAQADRVALTGDGGSFPALLSTVLSAWREPPSITARKSRPAALACRRYWPGPTER